MTMTELQKLNGGFGSQTIANTTEYNGKWQSIVVTADAVFFTLEESMQDGDEVNVDATGASEQGTTGAVVIPAGTVKVPARDFFTKIKLVSGTIETYKA